MAGEAGAAPLVDAAAESSHVLMNRWGPRQSLSGPPRRASPGSTGQACVALRSERYHDFAKPAGREEVRVHQLAGPPGPDPRAPGRTFAGHDRDFRAVRPRESYVRTRRRLSDAGGGRPRTAAVNRCGCQQPGVIDVPPARRPPARRARPSAASNARAPGPSAGAPPGPCSGRAPPSAPREVPPDRLKVVLRRATSRR